MLLYCVLTSMNASVGPLVGEPCLATCRGPLMVLAAPELTRIVRPVLSRTAAWIGRSARWPQNARVLALVMTNVVFVPSGKLAVPWNVSVPVECMIVPAVIVL